MNAGHSASVPQVLVVDDDLPLLEAAAAALQRTYRIHTATTGREAAEILRTHPIAAIVLDIRLGDENGLDLIEPFRALSTARIQILTGHSTEELAIRAVWAKADGYLKKPVNRDGLQEAVARLVPGDGVADDPLEQVRAHLDQDFHLAVSLEALARAAHLNPDYLRQAFTDRFGLSPHAYRTARRMQWAVRLLRTSGLPVKVVGLETGFPSASAFSAAFRRFHGVSPESFRLCQGPAPGEKGSHMSSGNDN